jgi:glyoxylase-like metal-dependent hydrolase (beta-lactamase superfamily II)
VIHRFSVGRLDCAVISDGQLAPPWEPPLDSFFTPDAGVPAAELAAAVAADSAGRTSLSCGYNCLLIETPGGVALVDTGLGAGFLGYGPAIGAQVGLLGERIAAAGWAASDVAAVLFTHLHQDHVRGATWSGKPTFPAARWLAHAAEVAFWSADSAEAAAGAAEHFQPAREAIRQFGARLRPFEYGEEVLPGIRTVDAAGHTPGHTAIVLESGGERLLSTGDAFYDRLQLSHPGWGTPWDHDRRLAAVSRRRLLAMAADEHILVHAYHLPFPGLGSVAQDGGAFTWRDAAVAAE